MRGIAVQCSCETAYVAVSFSVGLDEPLDSDFEDREGRGGREDRDDRGGRRDRRPSPRPRAKSRRKRSKMDARASTIAHLAEHVIATLTSAKGASAGPSGPSGSSAPQGPSSSSSAESTESSEAVEAAQAEVEAVEAAQAEVESVEAAQAEVEAVLAALRSTGIVQNAETSGSETCFHASGMPRDLALVWIPLLFSAIRDPNLSSRCVETERSAALDEMYGVRASASVTDGLLETHIERTEAYGSWPTRVDEDIRYLEREKTALVGAAIGAFIRTFYVPERMHVTVVGPDPELLLQTVRLAASAAFGPEGAIGAIGAVASADSSGPGVALPRAIYTGEYQDGAVSVIAGSEGDTTRVRFLQSVAITSDPVTVYAATCAAWCASELLFVALRVRANAVYSVHAALSMRAVNCVERDGEHDASIVVATVCTHDKAAHVVRVVRDTMRDIGPEIVADWRRAAVVAIRSESRGAVALGERARHVSVGATGEPLARSDRIALIESVTYEDVRDVLFGARGDREGRGGIGSPIASRPSGSSRSPGSSRAHRPAGYRVYASTGDTSPTRLQRAVSRGLKKQ